jgi:D-alanyl-lipoteichoic acid acyltransferase DltB (MBOAT superfamily)
VSPAIEPAPAPWAALADFALAPLRTTAWADWRGFWLGQVFDDRFLVCYFLPLLPLLLLAPRRVLRPAIVLTGLAFVAYVFGAFYAAFWLALCCAAYAGTQHFARQVADPGRAGRAIVLAWAVGLLAYFASFFLARLRLPDELALWLWEYVRLVYPVGLRGLGWEPDFAWLVPARYAQPVPSLPFAVFVNPHNIGTAYLAVRMLHYCSELRRGTIPHERRTLLSFLAYLCYAPNLMQGPIERYGTFQDELDGCHARRSWRNVAPALARMACGLGKGLIATLYFLPIIRAHFLPSELGGAGGASYFSQPERIESYGLLYFGVYIYIFWLYLEFSGYCDVSAGMARLLGYRQVENFNLPWIATSLRDFWRRWHISLSALLRDYVYIPLGGNRRHVTLNLCVTFALIGVWHYPLPQLLLWGGLMGLMLAVNQQWAQWAQRADESGRGALAAARRAARRLGPLPQVLAWMLTMHCFVHSLLLFFGGGAIYRVTWELIRRPLAALTG